MKFSLDEYKKATPHRNSWLINNDKLVPWYRYGVIYVDASFFSTYVYAHTYQIIAEIENQR